MRAMVNALRRAELRAKKRDARLAKKAAEKAVNLPAVDREEAKARAIRHTIVKVRDKNRAPFVQVIQENVRYLLKKDHLTTAELAFMFRLLPFVEFNSNALVDMPGKFISVTTLAELLGMSVDQTSRLVNALLKKGILYEIVDTQTLREDGRPTEERPLFFNPELVVATDKNRINLTLCQIHWQNDRLEKQGLGLPWKIWYAKGLKHGRLYRRSTYLKKKQKANLNPLADME